MELNLIWAQDRARAIGKDNTLPWRLPEDLAHFKRSTVDAAVIMGRKTFESLPNGALPRRLNIVMTRSPGSISATGITQVDSLASAVDAAAGAGHERVFVIGGEAIYAEAIASAARLLVTEVDVEVDGADAHAPAIPAWFATDEVPWLESSTGLRYRLRTYLATRSA